jgi:hypothetical protein
MTNPKRPYLNFLEFTIGYYEQALKLTTPGSDDFSMLSGCILLMVGLEKLFKHALYNINNVMILPDNKINFKALVSSKNNNAFENENTISCLEAFERLKTLFPSLKHYKSDVEFLIQQRNFLVHGFGGIVIGKLEGKFQTKIVELTETVCKDCLKVNPEMIFSKNDTWNKMMTIRNSYKKAVFLEVEQRIKHLRRRFSQGEPLGCEDIEISEKFEIHDFTCPICNNKVAKCGVEWDIDVDHRENVVIGAWEIPCLIKCDICKVTMNDVDEIQIMLDHEYSKGQQK